MENSLFNEKTIKRLVENIKPNNKQKESAQLWLDLMEKNELVKEKEGYLKFYDIILKELLGYDNIKHEKEGVEFSYEKEGKSIVRIEAKGMNTKDLFAPQKRVNPESPVQQLWRYMGLHATPYGIVTNYQTFVLFKYEVGSLKYHLFNFEDIKKDKNKLKELIALFSRESVNNGFVNQVYEKSLEEEREFTKEFYKLYHETRLMLITEFEENDKKITRAGTVHFAQLFLNRLMFVLFAEDTGKLREKILEEKILNMLDRNEDLLSPSTNFISNIIKSVFEDLNKGNPPEFFGFNGGLFSSQIPQRFLFKDFREDKFFKHEKQHSKLKKNLKLNEKEQEIFNKYKNKINPIIKNILLMASFDFKTEVNVNILGHIFEQSISDIENLQVGKEDSRRKKEGIFYTPEYITDYICRNTIIPYLSEKDSKSVSDLIKEYSDNIGELEKKFKEMKILDPACGSGAFLIKATDIMLEIFKGIQGFKQWKGEYDASILGKSKLGKGRLGKKPEGKQLSLKKSFEEDEAREIIENSIYGVDINDESVEITKLALFLKMARKNKKLTNLSNNIKRGNSLIDDPEVAGELAFDWDKEFPFKFDVVVGNPPYVSQKGTLDNPNIAYSERDYYRKKYQTLSKNELKTRGGVKLNLFGLWIEGSTHLLSKKGLLGLIVHKNLLKIESYKFLRKYILDTQNIREIIDLGAKIFEDVTGETIILILENETDLSNKIKIKTRVNLEKREYNEIKIKQSNFSDNSDYIFNIYENPFLRSLKQKLKENSKNLEEVYKIVSFGLNTSDNKKYFVRDKLGNKYKKAVMGRDIARWILKSAGYVFYDSSVLTRKGDVNSFNSEKLILQRIGAELTVAYDNEGTYCYNSTNMILQKDKNYNLKYLLCLLNSRLINYYYVNMFSMKSHLTVNVTQGYLSQIPIPKISPAEQKPFIEKADKMLKMNKEFYEKKEKFLKLIKHEYNIGKITRKLDKFYNLEFDDFMEQLKVDLNMSKKAEILDFFGENKKELLKLKNEIDNTDNKINEMVYKLYGLTEEEIGVVEGGLE